MCENHAHSGQEVRAGAGDPFQAFLHETPDHAGAWREAVHRLEHASELEPRTLHLAYLAVLAALGLHSGIPLHVELARDAGATRKEIASAALVGLPAAGNRVIQSLPIALAAFDAAESPAGWVEALDGPPVDRAAAAP